MIYVFLDTNVYFKGLSGTELIDPAQDYFPHLVRHAKKGRIALVMPAVVKAEIEARIRTAAYRCGNAINALTLPNASVELTPLITKLRAEYDPVGTAEEMQQKFAQFWADTGCIVQDVSAIDTEKLMLARSMYTLPFIDRKYDIYRDAFVMQALEEFRKSAMTAEDRLAVISGDQSFCDYVQKLDQDILVFSDLHGLFNLWGKSNTDMIALLNEGIHELELDSRICEELDGFAFSLTNGESLLQFDDLTPEIVTDADGKKQMQITGYEVIDTDSALLSFEADVRLTFSGAVIPETVYDTDGDIGDVQFRTADITRTVSLSGWTDILGKFDADDSIDFVEDLNDLEFDSETGSMVIDISDENTEIVYDE